MICPVERHRSFGCKAAIFNWRLITGRSAGGLRRARDRTAIQVGTCPDGCSADKARALAYRCRRGSVRGKCCARKIAAG